MPPALPPRAPAPFRAEATASPVPIAGLASERDKALLAACGGAGDAGLFDVARRIVARKARGAATFDDDGIAFAQRAAGEPHPWARSFVATGTPRERALAWSPLAGRVAAWRAHVASRPSDDAAPGETGALRCGVASGHAPDGTEIVALVAVDALADLAPLASRAHAGQWLTVDVHMLVPATGARVVVQGPGSAPRGVPTSFDAARGRVRARFAPDRPGAFTVQVMADLAAGPRPVLEASVFADVEPPAAPDDTSAAPGEELAARGSPGDALFAMMEAARAEAGLRPLSRDARLDAIALAHARAMIASGTLGHDVGDGDPSERLQNANIAARDAGENVAHAENVALAHRALWSSPSHRANLVRPDFDRGGAAVVADPHGDGVWVVQLFAASPAGSVVDRGRER